MRLLLFLALACSTVQATAQTWICTQALTESASVYTSREIEVSREGKTVLVRTKVGKASSGGDEWTYEVLAENKHIEGFRATRFFPKDGREGIFNVILGGEFIVHRDATSGALKAVATGLNASSAEAGVSRFDCRRASR